MYKTNAKSEAERTELHSSTNLWMCQLTSSWEGMDDKPFSSSSVITLCARPKAVVGLSHTLIPILLLPFLQVSGGVTTVTSKDRVGEEGATLIGGGTAASTFSSLCFLFFESKVSLARGSFFRSLIRAYLSLLYWVAISVYIYIYIYNKKKAIPI